LSDEPLSKRLERRPALSFSAGGFMPILDESKNLYYLIIISTIYFSTIQSPADLLNFIVNKKINTVYCTLIIITNLLFDFEK
jgi:hypothetical protein